MILFESTLALLLAAVLIAALSRRIGLPYPALLALAGTALAVLPLGIEIEIEPDLALALFIAPVLLDAAFDTSPRELKRNAVALASLAVVAVLLTTAAVAYVGVAFAGLPLTAAIVLGAIVAPPDAAAATAVLSQVKAPRRVMALLQGESLLNDATALLVYRMGVAAAAGGFTLAHAAPMVALSGLGSIVAGHLLARLYVIATKRVEDVSSAIVLQFVATFGVWLFAERVGLSAIITMVVYAITLARLAPRRYSPRNRVSAYSVWETVVFVLNVLAFVLMGLQARPILDRLSGDGIAPALTTAGAVLATVILVRIVWVIGAAALSRLARRITGGRSDVPPPDAAGDILVAWCGMRGLVTLATAFALPAGFPGRDVIVLTAFAVVLGTLVVQGLTLDPLRRMLRLGHDDSIDREVSRGRVAVMQAALDSLADDGSHAAAAVRDLYAAARRIAENPAEPQAASDYDRLRLKAIGAQRVALEGLRRDGTIEDEAYRRLQEEIDWAELDAAPAGHFQPLAT